MMATNVVLVPVSVVVDTIVSFYDNDTEKVLAFYDAAYDKLWGKSPEVDAILDGIDLWLMNNRWMPRFDLENEDWDAYVSGKEAGLP